MRNDNFRGAKKEFWDERYGEDEFVYGTEPNEFFKEFIDSHPPGKILLPAEGEGKNGVYAATKGWQVHAFDFSTRAREKALRLAKQKNVTINYQLADYREIVLPKNEYDAIGLFYAHMPSYLRRDTHRKYISALKPGGTIILEAFSKAQIHRESGGPRDVDLLFSPEDLRGDFASLTIGKLVQLEVELKGGGLHSGMADIIRMIALKTA